WVSARTKTRNTSVDSCFILSTQIWMCRPEKQSRHANESVTANCESRPFTVPLAGGRICEELLLRHSYRRSHASTCRKLDVSASQRQTAATRSKRDDCVRTPAFRRCGSRRTGGSLYKLNQSVRDA